MAHARRRADAGAPEWCGLTGQALFSSLDLLFTGVFLAVLFAYSAKLALIVVGAIPIYLIIAFGIRPIPRLMFLLQDFISLAPSRGPAIQRTSYAKLQGSLVYDLTPRWSVQVGAFRTISGHNAVRETGPLAALWMRF